MQEELNAFSNQIAEQMGSPSERSKRRYGTVWGALEQPFWKQPQFLAGVASFPAVLIMGSLVALADFPAASVLLHKLMGTEVAVSQSLKTDGSPLRDLVDKRIVAASKDDTEFIKEISEIFPKRVDMNREISKQVKKEIQAKYGLIDFATFKIGLTKLHNSFYTDKLDWRTESNIPHTIPIPENHNVDITIVLQRQVYSISLVERAFDLKKNPISKDKRTEFPNDAINTREIEPGDIPTIYINGQEAEMENTPMFPAAITKTKNNNTKLLKINNIPGKEYPGFNSNMLSLNFQHPKRNKDTLWHITVFVRLSDTA